MTLWVVSVVAAVSIVILLLASAVLVEQYEDELKKDLREHADATTHAVDMRMSRVLCATRTAALLSSDDAQDLSKVDTLLYRTLQGMGCVDAISVIYRKGFFDPKDTVNYFERSSFFSKADHVINLESTFFQDLETTDDNWTESYIEGRNFLCGPYYEKISGQNEHMVCYSVPLSNSQGERYGIFTSSILLEWMFDLVMKNKTRTDIDVAIIDVDGDYVLEPDPAIQELLDTDPNRLITEERDLPELGWHLMIRAPRTIILDKVHFLLRELALMLCLLLLVISAAVVLVVRYIGKPFAIEQQQTAEAKAAMQRELDIASGTQRELVPHVFPPFPDRKDIDLHACLHPALNVGGDLYDYFIHDEHLYFCIGDVSGKGVPASLFMAATHYLFRSVASSLPIAEAVAQINRSLCTDNNQCMFVTFWFGCLDLHNGQLEFVNAGHNAPILSTAEGTQFVSVVNGMPLGVWDEAPYQSSSLTLHRGDSLLLYTDGVTEAMDAENRQLGDDATLAAAASHAHASAHEQIDAMLERVRDHAQGTTQSDDITMLCVKLSK